MKFLYRLYDQQYFGIILFIIIITLLLLFLIIFFFGKKDEKEQLEKTRKLELASANKNKLGENDVTGYKEVDGNTKELVIPEIEQPEMVQEEPEIDPFENVESSTVQLEVTEPQEKIDINSLFELPEEDVKEEPINIVEPTPVEAPFSSVYTEEKKEENIPFEMPKLVEMPKLKTEEPKEETISNNLFEEKPQVENNIFDNIENETYDINGRHL